MQWAPPLAKCGLTRQEAIHGSDFMCKEMKETETGSYRVVMKPFILGHRVHWKQGLQNASRCVELGRFQLVVSNISWFSLY